MATTNSNFKVKNGLDAGGNISTTGNMSISLGSDIVGSTLRGSNGQTANLQNWQTWNGTTATTVASVTSGGSIYSAGNLGAGSLTALSTARLSVSAAASGIGVIVRGNATTPGNLQEWQDSATNILSNVTGTGVIRSTLSMQALGMQSVSDGSQSMGFSANRNVQIGATTGVYGGGSGVIGITNATTAPTTAPTGGGILYVDTGALKYRGTSGTAATIVNADGTMAAGGSFTGGTLTSNLTLATGTTSVSPLTFASGTNLTTVTAGVVEYDGTVFYQTSNTNPGRALATQNYYYASSADYFPDFSTSGAVKSMLGGATTGITLAAGTTYEYEFYTTVRHQYITATGVSGTYAITSTTVSGSPTVSVIHQIDYGSNTVGFTTATTLSTVRNTGSLAFSATISSGSRYNFLRVKGLIRVTGTGTVKIYPGLSTDQVGAQDNVWTVQSGTVFKLTPIGNGTVTTVGAWA